VIEPAIQLPPLSEDKETRLYQKSQFFNDVIEERVRRHPEQWLWLHRRWKEYRGEPRWKLPMMSVFLFAFLLGLSGCTTPGETQTGIALPADPKIATPEFKQEPEMAEPVEFAENQKVMEEKPKAKSKKKMVKVEKKEIPTVKPVEPPTFKAIAPDKIPFELGEQLEIQLGWMGLPAGTATIEVRTGPEFNSRPTYQLWGNILSSKLVDAIYHVDNTIESFVDREGMIPYKFLLHMSESAQKKETRVSFDHVQKKAFYWAQRISQKWGDELNDRADDLVPSARDMFSAIYFARSLDYKLNEKRHFYIYENGKNWEVELLPGFRVSIPHTD
jgi:hypothetical protein